MQTTFVADCAATVHKLQLKHIQKIQGAHRQTRRKWEQMKWCSTTLPSSPVSTKVKVVEKSEYGSTESTAKWGRHNCHGFFLLAKTIELCRRQSYSGTTAGITKSRLAQHPHMALPLICSYTLWVWGECSLPHLWGSQIPVILREFHSLHIENTMLEYEYRTQTIMYYVRSKNTFFT